MKQYVGVSKNMKLSEATSGLQNPKLLIMVVSDKEVFADKVKELEERYPNVPSIGCVGQSYGNTTVLEHGILVVGMMDNIIAITNVIENVSEVPVKSIAKIEADVRNIGGNSNNTVCIDLCSSNDECVLTTINSVLKNKKISLTGGTVWEETVSCNGVVYQDACVYALVRNDGGKVKVYKENLYTVTPRRHIVTKANPDNNIIDELDGQKVETIYINELGIQPSAIKEQTFVNPFGRCIGEDVFIVSIKENLSNKSFSCFRKVNPMDILNILELGDYNMIVNETVHKIKSDFVHISGIFSINCLFRYLLFQQNNYVEQYFENMAAVGLHAGLIGLGEHYNTQHTNQTFSCVVFE